MWFVCFQKGLVLLGDRSAAKSTPRGIRIQSISAMVKGAREHFLTRAQSVKLSALVAIAAVIGGSFLWNKGGSRLN